MDGEAEPVSRLQSRDNCRRTQEVKERAGQTDKNDRKGLKKQTFARFCACRRGKRIADD
jgi:hypothetical protein